MRPFALLLPQLRGELWKLFARRRTYIGFGAFLFIEVLFMFLQELPFAKRGIRHIIEQGGFAFEEYFSGLTVAFMVVHWTALLLGALYLALIAGDVVAKEVEEGTMRLILSRPASRARVIWVRYLAAIVYTFALMAFITISAMLMGFAKQGFGGMFIWVPAPPVYGIFDFWPGLTRYLLAAPLLGLSFMTITSMGFLFSCCNMKPAAATILCLSYFFIDMILQNIPQFHDYQNWFLTTHIRTWIHIFQTPVPISHMIEDYAWLLGADGTFFAIGLLIFQTRDFKA